MQKKHALHQAAKPKKQNGIFIEQSSRYCDTDLDGAGVRLRNSENFPLFSSAVCLTDQQMERAQGIAFCLFLSHSLRVLRRNETCRGLVEEESSRQTFYFHPSLLLLPRH